MKCPSVKQITAQLPNYILFCNIYLNVGTTGVTYLPTDIISNIEQCKLCSGFLFDVGHFIGHKFKQNVYGANIIISYSYNSHHI